MTTTTPVNGVASPLMISKKELRHKFNISSRTLRRRILTDSFLEAAGFTWEEIRPLRLLPPALTSACLNLTYPAISRPNLPEAA